MALQFGHERECKIRSKRDLGEKAVYCSNPESTKSVPVVHAEHKMQDKMVSRGTTICNNLSTTVLVKTIYSNGELDLSPWALM